MTTIASSAKILHRDVRAGEGGLGATGSVEGAATSPFSAGGNTSPCLISTLPEGLGGTGVSVSSLLMIGACRVGLGDHNMGSRRRSHHFPSRQAFRIRRDPLTQSPIGPLP
jgi:hypothetical protein